MFRRRTGIHPAVLIVGSAAISAAFSPEIRKRVMKMFTMKTQDGMLNPAELFKQAFSTREKRQTEQNQTHSNDKNQQHTHTTTNYNEAEELLDNIDRNTY
ncbi:hypothetical protein HOO54_07085 [Bacillus sp. WMMC1349]|uniref:hypothetical protein n=1 Tax=Bacillus sp. WMMC1349 TaxID=2736254 RepID=UPI0015576086|nr:hypothetical protein [Bacillus sp. WMMC1349]NPC91982.1 hypothetical protein [Bacillus sp. WMMC1349]